MKNFKQASKTIAIYFIGACISFTVLGLFASANASESSVSEKSIESCTSISGLAKSIMKARQNGGEMSVMMGISEGNPLAKMLVKAAFEEPFYSTDEYKERAVIEFSNKVMLICMRDD